MINSFTGQYRFLSNFWPCNIFLDSVSYPSVENAYQASKTTDLEIRKKFVYCTPGKAKRFWRESSNLVRSDWPDIKLAVMLSLVGQKFLAEDLANLLLATGDVQIVEGNTWGDTYWGICNGVGDNHLGKILSQIRYELSAEADYRRIFDKEFGERMMREGL